LILVAEDNEEEVLLIRRALEKSRLANPLHVVSTAEDAIAYLMGEGKFNDRLQYPLPELLILDLQLPGIGALEVLHLLRQHPGLKAIRVVVLASPADIRGVNLAYQFGANSFLVKPVILERFLDTILTMNGYFLWTNPAARSSPCPSQAA